MSDPLVLPLTAIAPVELVGGKGHVLACLCKNGFQVPRGQVLTTHAYLRFVEHHNLEARLLETSLPVVQSGMLDFSQAESHIQSIFNEHPLTEELHANIAAMYDFLDGPVRPLAVRSSATLEDQPQQSFAGQHASFLDIQRFEAFVDAIKHCWVSLWSERALSYRYHSGILNTHVAMAVVIQQYIEADVAGVLFTANPLTGERNHMLVNANPGPGELVVSGDVDPDTFVLDRPTLSVKSTRFGQRQASEDDGTENKELACLSDQQLTRLGSLAEKIEKLFADTPQDIEWVFGEDELWVLQSRAITNLPPEPLTNVRWDPPEPGAYLQRTQWVEHVPDPVSTLFEDLHMRQSLQAAWGLNLARRGNHDFEDTQPPASFCLTTTVNGFAYRQVGEPPRSGRLTHSQVKTPSRLRRFGSKLRIYLTFTARWRYIALPRYLKEIRRWQQLNPSTASLEQLWRGLRALSQADAAYWFNGGAWNAFSLSRGTESLLQNFLKENCGNQFSSGQFLRGLKSAAFDGQAELCRIAQMIRRNDMLYSRLIKHPPHQMFDLLAELPQGKEIQAEIDGYFSRFGHQVSTLDFCEPLSMEQPFNTALALHRYLLQPNLDPSKNRAKIEDEQRLAVRSAAKTLRIKAKLRFFWLLWLARRFYPYREAAMFHLGQAWTVLRPFALTLGHRLTERRILRSADDVFYLTSEELGLAIRSVLTIDRLPDAHRKAHYPNGVSMLGLAEKVNHRRILRTRRMNLNPPKLIPGPPPWAPLTSTAETEQPRNLLVGSPVSPGKVTGEACVIRSVEDFAQVRQGSILVCPTTTPAWTAIFPQIIGLVTDIGGILAHGSIVAREFGIPAVLGLVYATQRIQDGQMITVDGSAGTVELD